MNAEVEPAIQHVPPPRCGWLFVGASAPAFLFSALALARQRKSTEAEILAAMPWTENDE